MKSLWMLVGLLGSPWKHVLGPGLPVLMWDHGRLLLLLRVITVVMSMCALLNAISLYL